MFKDRLRYLREYQKWSQGEVAKRLNITQATYSRYEAGIHQPGIEVLKSMSKLFNVSIDYLVENDCGVAEISNEVDLNDFILNGKYTIASKFPDERDRRIINSLVNSVYRIDELTYIWPECKSSGLNLFLG